MSHPFKAYDVRGLYGKDIDEDLAYKIGRAFVEYTGAANVAVGRDMRLSSASLSENLIKGITDAGADVIDIGLASTDMLYFASIDLGTDGAIQVTASHNSKEYNGFKFCRQNAIPIGIESGLADIEKIVRSGNFSTVVNKGKVTSRNLKSDFISFMHSFVNPADLKPLSVVVDTGNGMGGYIIPDLLEGSPVKVTPMFFELDGTFPNHDANPLEEKNRKDLISRVVETGADLGVGLDGDTDRAFFIDGKGNFCSGDFILGLLAKDVLKKHRGATIVYDVRCSRYVKDTVEKLGGIPKMWKVGHAYAKIYMKETGAEFGGEVSGHYYFRYKNAYFDSGNLTVLVLLKVLSDYNLTLTEALEETSGYFISGEINSVVKDPDLKIEAVKKYYEERAEC
ncbi:MAG: phosphomannomutase/phosphoglucomutase, partial [Oligoflexia bacterium]|nr:phosphomannomutase/phosphoglucomutase [Oligoflexia bacterium]